MLNQQEGEITSESISVISVGYGCGKCQMSSGVDRYIWMFGSLCAACICALGAATALQRRLLRSYVVDASR